MADGDRPPDDGGPLLTREFLLSGRLPELIRQMAPEVRVLSDEERQASLAAMLAARPENGDGVWVFAYGSLIWNPMVHHTARVAVQAPDWHRAFCLSVTSGRGTPDQPGLMLGLRPGGGCGGVAFRIAEELVAGELELLWRREMVADGYIPRWVGLRDPAGRPLGAGVAFTINPEGRGFAGDLGDHEVADRLAVARGRLGTGAEYLFRTRDGLRELGIACPFVERIAALVERHPAQDGGRGGC